MASRWNRNASYGGGGNAYMNSGGMNVGFYMGGPPTDRRPYNAPVGKPFYGGYRDDYGRRSDSGRRDDIRGGKRGPPKGRSPAEKRFVDAPPSQRRDSKPFGKRQAPFGKYEVKVPRVVFDIKSRSFTDVRHHYPRLNVASDFYDCLSSWSDSFPMHSPFKLGNATDYHVFHRDVEPPAPADTTLLNPADADYSYSARVMLMACPQLGELYKNTCRMADEQNSGDKIAPGKSIHFLVGGRAKSETMALGGPWSPSLDGPNPSSDPKTLINTAIRTFKGYTGLDLSSCNEWIRFMEIRYYRYADSKAPSFTGDEEERTVTAEKPEVVVFFIPNAAHLIPSDEEWTKTKEYYSSVLQKLLTPEKKPEPESTEVTEQENSVVDASMEETDEANPSTDAEPTHYSKLDINSLKVNELRNELAARSLDTKGLKVNLVARLQEALDNEKKADTNEEVKPEPEEKAEETPAKPTSPTTQSKEDSKELSEKERRRLERLYRLNEKPAIIIHPNKNARGGRFDCHRVSLFSLLDYRPEDQKEHNFEVSLFAEQFHEMLQRDCAFTIFKAINDAPEKEHKTEPDAKTENGVDNEEPESKRRRNDSQVTTEETDTPKVRHLRRTVHPDLLFAFTYYDLGHSGFIREHDLCEILHLLGLCYSRLQMRKLVSKVVSRRDHVQYHQLTDRDIVEGDSDDVVSINEKTDSDVDKMLAYGNRALFDLNQAPIPAKITVGGTNAELTSRLERAETTKRQIEFQFFQLKDELEKTRVHVNTFKDTEDGLREQNAELTSRMKTEQKQLYEYKSLTNVYYHLLRNARDQMERVTGDINKQFDKEKAKREAEKTAAEAEKAKAEPAAETESAPNGVENEDSEKNEEKDWTVVDTV